MAGEVLVEEQRIDKPGTRIDTGAEIRVRNTSRYVGRGGMKLEAALQHFGIDPTGWICLDIGASTGGFTDCLLQHGAARVHAIDVGHSQLDWKIRRDPRVVVREKLNARYLTRADVPDPIDLCVIDVSFISLTRVLAPAAALLKDGGLLVALIKPQFELSREEVAKGGIVRDAAARARAVERIETFVRKEMRANWNGVIPSPIQGADGNVEFLCCISPMRG
jgi:23S rRNA (cytidine1920-2'-O)/16S rRNA (cytidine1409-2'-O)-methyltransferase